MTVIARTAPPQRVEVDRGDAGGAGACDVVGQTVADVAGGAGVDADALERDTEDMRIGLGGADARRIDNG